MTGRRLRVDPAPARTVGVALSRDDVLGDSDALTSTVLEMVHARSDVSPSAVPVVLVPASTTLVPGVGTPCAYGGPRGVVVFLDNCARPSTSSTWPSATSRTVAHEIGHALGAVAECAPHHTDGHVGDDSTDLMYAAGQAAPVAVTLDTDRRDYFDHDNPGCPDILDSPLWAD